MNYFERILIPVDFTINTEVAVKKATYLATPGISEIYFFHVAQSAVSTPGFSFLHRTSEPVVERLHQLRSGCESTIPDVKINTVIRYATSVENTIISFAKEIRSSLIIIGKNNYHSFFPFLNTVVSSNIAEETGCAVLTVKPGSLKRGLATIVLPVGNSFSNRNIDLLLTLDPRTLLNIHLLTILNKDQHPDDYSASVLLQALRSIRNRLQSNVKHTLIHSNNKGIATLRYAEQVNADMILVNPEIEATINTWISKNDTTDILIPASQVQVLSVKPD